MTELQTKWAAQHDWFLSAFETGTPGRWMVFVQDDQVYNFSNFQLLCDWAGY